MMLPERILLGVNIDHVATLRQARGTRYPDPVYAAQLAESAGADGITIHLREDRRHIQERDVRLLKETLNTPMNLEIAVTDSMLRFTQEIKPEHICLVPEKREELTTEGGLDVLANEAQIAEYCAELQADGGEVSLFIDADERQIDAALRCKAKAIELHTGCFADAMTASDRQQELRRIERTARYAFEQGLIVNAGHGLHYHNVAAIAAIMEVNELNIGHAIVSHALFVGMVEAVKSIQSIMQSSRQAAHMQARLGLQ